MAKVIKAARVPNEMIAKIDDSCERIGIERGMKPSFSAWMIEAMAEKLKREEDNKK